MKQIINQFKEGKINIGTLYNLLFKYKDRLNFDEELRNVAGPELMYKILLYQKSIK